MSDSPAPDMVSDRSLSLSGSVDSFEVSDLFFKIDLDRRWDSKFGDASIESIDSDSFLSVFPEAKECQLKKV